MTGKVKETFPEEDIGAMTLTTENAATEIETIMMTMTSFKVMDSMATSDASFSNMLKGQAGTQLLTPIKGIHIFLVLINNEQIIYP